MRAKSTPFNYQTQLDPYDFYSDTTEDKGGSGKFPRPHELLESALAACMNMSLKMTAQKLGLKQLNIETEVTLDRSQKGKTVFNYRYAFSGENLTEETLAALKKAAETCPVRKTLSENLEFKEQLF